MFRLLRSSPIDQLEIMLMKGTQEEEEEEVLGSDQGEDFDFDNNNAE